MHIKCSGMAILVHMFKECQRVRKVWYAEEVAIIGFSLRHVALRNNVVLH